MVFYGVPKRVWFLVCTNFIANQYGATNEHIARAFGISIGVLNQWIEDNPELANAIKEGRDNWDTGKVELTLLRRAMGYEYIEKRVKRIVVDAVPHSLLPINLSRNALVSL